MPVEMTDQQRRAFSLELARDIRERGDSVADMTVAAKMFDSFIQSGELENDAITTVYEEGAYEARFEVLEAVFDHFEGKKVTRLALRELFRLKGWATE